MSTDQNLAAYAVHPLAPVDSTHDANLRSWVESANDPTSDFPIQNLPFCQFVDAGPNSAAEREPSGHLPPVHLGVAIGDMVLNLSVLSAFNGLENTVIDMDDLHSFSIAERASLRRELSLLLSEASTKLRDLVREVPRLLRSRSEVLFARPALMANYTDFYASINHASTVGSMFRPDNPLLPNYKHIPIGYHGRASSIIISGVDVVRPLGQQSPPDNAPQQGPSFGPCKMLDYELEVGCVITRENLRGEPVGIQNAAECILGLCLVNDWSARDVQKWEYQPLGPFLAKNFATTVSPFLVTLEALAPFRCVGSPRADGDPQPLPYLSDAHDLAAGGFDINLEVTLQSRQMQQQGIAPITLSKGRGFRDMYWTFAQMIAHHTSNGCNLIDGDLLASGTVSGTSTDSRGCLLELTWDGPGKPRKPITLPTGETRVFLADGDTVTLRGYCEREGFRRIGLGECTGTILPAVV
jgi:fumarylacetoacetase